jgi:hypothetical protein
VHPPVRLRAGDHRVAAGGAVPCGAGPGVAVAEPVVAPAEPAATGRWRCPLPKSPPHPLQRVGFCSVNHEGMLQAEVERLKRVDAAREDRNEKEAARRATQAQEEAATRAALLSDFVARVQALGVPTTELPKQRLDPVPWWNRRKTAKGRGNVRERPDYLIVEVPSGIHVWRVREGFFVRDNGTLVELAPAVPVPGGRVAQREGLSAVRLYSPGWRATDRPSSYPSPSWDIVGDDPIPTFAEELARFLLVAARQSGG